MYRGRIGNGVGNRIWYEISQKVEAQLLSVLQKIWHLAEDTDIDGIQDLQNEDVHWRAIH